MLRLLGSVAALQAACGPPAGAGGVPRLTTGLEALRIALPDLRRRHADGAVVSVATVDAEARPDGPESWGIGIDTRDADNELWFIYVVERGVLRVGPAARSVTPSASPRPPRGLMQLGEPVPGVMDSDEAIRVAEASGGRRFRERTGAVVRTMRLAANGPDESPNVWSIYYVGAQSHSYRQLSLVLDASTGQLIKLAEGDN